MNVFDSAPEFILSDNRTKRIYSPVSAQQMQNKHEALLPPALVAGKTILDIGSCLGATGHWCLSNDAASYTGVEPQAEYTTISEALFSKYHPGKARVITKPMADFFASSSEVFDIVVILGVLHACTDQYDVLRKLSTRAKHIVAIEDLVPRISAANPAFAGIEFYANERTNLADQAASIEGRGARISPAGLSFIMSDFGFHSDEGVLSPEAITDTVDNFNTPKHPGNARYLMRFNRIGRESSSVADDLARGDKREARPWSGPATI